jgi:hypothetical protein
MWYVRREVAKRNAFFYLVGNSVGGFGGVLAYGLMQMDGIAGHAGWRWIFIWEGIITAIIAITGFIFLVDFPEDAHKTKFFLHDEEIKIMVDRVDRDRGDAHVTEFNIWSYLAEAKDWKCWCFATNFGLAGLVTYSASYFLPIILRESLGFDVAKAQCLTAPVSVVDSKQVVVTDNELVLCAIFPLGLYGVLRLRSVEHSRPYHRIQCLGHDCWDCGFGLRCTAIRSLFWCIPRRRW